MDAGVVLLAVGLVFLSGSALAAFAWAAGDGQFDRLDAGADSIFDAEEPVGVRGDCFPDEPARAARRGEST